MSKPFLFVIARGDSKRFDLAMRHFGDEPAVEIVYDRRAGDRRTRCTAWVSEEERRWGARRGLDISEDLSVTGWAYIRRQDAADEPRGGAERHRG
jgi:hypothetical protein